MAKARRSGQTKQDEVRELALSSLEAFISLVAPYRLLGPVHKELIAWWTRQRASDHQLVLLPRDHQKSAMVAYRTAWEITKDPTLTVLYMSATATLAEKQLSFIKNIFTSSQYMKYFPEMITPDEGKREKWTATEICVDHPRRKALGIRDATITTAGLNKTITGLHFDLGVLDDVVVPDNAYTGEGRNKVKAAYSQIASIESSGAREWVVGTRYHPGDLYSDMMSMEEEVFKGKELVSVRPVYETFERVIEDSPQRDGTGDYLWPKMQRYDGKWFGFDPQERARKYAKYLDKGQFYAQYYNDPNDPDNLKINPEYFQYFDRSNITLSDGNCYFGKKLLKVYAAIDFAVTTNKNSDYTAIVVVGIDEDGNYYIIDITRFKTTRIIDMFERIINMKMQWDFIKLRAETTAAQKAIVSQIKETMKERGIYFSIDEYNPTGNMGTKEERMLNTLLPRYEALSVWHYQGGNTAILEEELTSPHPAHDDMMDALTSAIDIAVKPVQRRKTMNRSNVIYNSRFGGLSL